MASGWLLPNLFAPNCSVGAPFPFSAGLLGRGGLPFLGSLLNLSLGSLIFKRFEDLYSAYLVAYRQRQCLFRCGVLHGAKGFEL